MPEALPQPAQGSSGAAAGMGEPRDDGRPWLTLTEAAATSGRHIDALRALVKRGRVPARKNNLGQWLVQLPDGQANGQGAAQGSPGPAPTGAPAAPEAMAELRARLAKAEADAERWRGLAEERGMAQARAEGEAKALRDALEDLAIRLDKATEELRELRVPWWRRWWG
jgi:hypothetical protein